MENVMAERLGLWLARMALLITGNRKLANASRVLPLLPKRGLMICVRPADRPLFEWLGPGTWAYWRSAESPFLNSLNPQNYRSFLVTHDFAPLVRLPPLRIAE